MPLFAKLKDGRFWRDFDWALLFAALMLVTLGIVEIYSSLPKESYWTKQMIWVGVGLVALFFSAVFDYRRIYNFVPHIYGAGIVMLILVLMFGEVVKGQRNWIKLGFFNLQPSEFVKLAVILALARYLSPLWKSDLPLKDLAVAC